MRRAAPAEPLPGFIPPMLLEAGAPRSLESHQWAVEVKFDGIRVQLRVEASGEWCLRSRPGRDCTSKFPELEVLAQALAGHDIVFDGELVYLGSDGRPHFDVLRRRLTTGERRIAEAGVHTPTTFVAFDLLHLDGLAVRALPYVERRALLVEILPSGERWRLAPSWTQRLEDVVAVTRQHQLEGVVFKRLDSSYRPGRRSPTWRKLKHRRDQTLSVTAWTPGHREPDVFYLARTSPGSESVFAGAARLGLDRERRDQLRQLLSEREIATPRRRRIRAVQPGISLRVSAHGPEGGPLRDAVIREIIVDASGA